jgi:polysaccharide pyruvyl transferase WcaK-like protein
MRDPEGHASRTPDGVPPSIEADIAIVRKIGLLTPYTGHNLGDAAIQEAALAAIAVRRPGAEIFLVTLDPILTTARHGIPSFPLSAAPPARAPQGMRDAVAGTFLAPGLKAGYRVISRARALGREVPHAVRAFRVMKGVDILVVSGGGQLDDYWGGPWRQPYALLKWGLIARARGARYVFLSVGTGVLGSRSSLALVRAALRLADYRSFRDKKSKALLSALAFTGQDDVRPDLAFGYTNRSLGSSDTAPDGASASVTVGVSPIAYLSEGWPETDLPRHERHLAVLVRFTAALLERGYAVVLFSTGYLDREVVRLMVDRLEREYAAAGTDRLSHARTHTLDELFGLLGRVDYVVASRLHGILLSHLLAIPVLAISCDRKVDTYMSDAHMEAYCQDIDALDVEALLRGFDGLISDREIIVRVLRENRSRNIEDLDAQSDVVFGRKLSVR